MTLIHHKIQINGLEIEHWGTKEAHAKTLAHLKDTIAVKLSASERQTVKQVGRKHPSEAQIDECYPTYRDCKDNGMSRLYTLRLIQKQLGCVKSFAEMVVRDIRIKYYATKVMRFYT